MTKPRGKNFTYEYDNIVTDRLLKGVSPTGIPNEFVYNLFGNPVITRIRNRGQILENTLDGYYKIRLKGTENCIRLIDNKIALVKDICGHDKWRFEKTVVYYPDNIGRITRKRIGTGNSLTKYEYITNGKRTSLLIKSVDNIGDIYSYKYDKLGNILSKKVYAIGTSFISTRYL